MTDQYQTVPVSMYFITDKVGQIGCHVANAHQLSLFLARGAGEPARQI